MQLDETDNQNVFVVSLSEQSSETVTVAFATANGTALAGTDYSATSGTLTFSPGQVTQTISVSVTSDTLDEEDETFLVNLSNASGATIADGQATGSINDDDDPVSISVADTSVWEGDGNLIFTLTLSGLSGRQIVVNCWTQDNTAGAPDDYTAASGPVTFAPGVTSRTFTVPIVAELYDEDDESFYVHLAGPENADIADGTAEGTIRDDDPLPQLSVALVSQSEAGSMGGNAAFVFDVALTGLTHRAVRVDYATANGTAASTSDYTAASGSLLFTAGTTLQRVTISVTNDTLRESDETFKLVLSNPVHASITTGTALGVILDNDATAQTNAGEQIIDGGSDFHAGVVRTAYSTPNGTTLQYNTLNAARPLVVIETVQPQDSAVPSLIKAELTFGGIASTPVYFSGQGLSAGDPLRFVMHVDGTSLASGTYNYTLKLTETHGSEVSYRTFTGQKPLINRLNSPFGKLWWLDGLDYISIQDDWVDVVFANGSASRFFEPEEPPPQGSIPYDPPPWARETLVKNTDGTFDLNWPDGATSHFNTSGQLVTYTDRNGNVTSYTYTSGLLTQIEHPFTRTTTLAYSGGLLESITDEVGRVTLFDHSGGQLVEIDDQDPESLSGTNGPVTAFAYAANGLLAEITDAESNTLSFEYDVSGRLEKRIYADDTFDVIAPVLVQGLVDVAAGTGTQQNPAALFSPDDCVGSVTDALARTTMFRTDYLGQPTEITLPDDTLILIERNAMGLPTEITRPDPDGSGPLGQQVTQMSYDARGNMTLLVLPGGAERAWTYDETWNQVLTYEDEVGRTITNTLDDETGDILTTKLNNNTTTMTYTPPPTQAGDLPGGLLLSVTDAEGRITVYGYEDDPQDADFARLISITYADGTSLEHTVTLEYDAAGNLAAYVDGEGRRTEWLYDLLNRLTQITLEDPDGNGSQTSPVYSFVHDAVGNVIEETDALGNVTSYTLDELYRVTLVTLPDPDGAGSLASPTIAYAYDDAGQLISETNPLGATTVYTFTDLGQIETITLPDPDGQGPASSPIYSYMFDLAGNIASVTDPLNNVTAYKYDIRDRLIEVVGADPDGSGGPLTSPGTAYAYNAASDLTSVTDALGRVTSYSYNGSGWLETITLPDLDGPGGQSAPQIWREYDGVGNVIDITDVLGQHTLYQFDALNRVIEITLPDPDGLGGSLDSPVIAYAYNFAGEVTSITDPLGRITTREYDALGRLIEMTLPDPDGQGSATSPVYAWTYDAVGNVLTSTDARGGVTSREYDNLYRLIELTLPDPDDSGSLASPVIAYAWNAAGWLTEVIDAMGRETDVEYDNLGRRTKIIQDDPDGGGSATRPETTFSFDAVGNLLAVTDPLGQTTNYAYDNLYRRTSVQQPDPDATGPLGRPTTTFGFDAVGNMTSLTDPVGNTTVFTFDALNRLIEEENELGKSRFYEYDFAGNITELTDRNGLVRQFSYDNLQRRTQEVWLDGQTTVNTIDFAYDAASQLTSASDDFSGYEYAYDGLGRVTQIDVAAIGTSSIEARLLQTFDASGNRTSLAAQFDIGSGWVDDFLTSFTFDDLNRMIRIEQEGQSGGNAVAEKRVDLEYNAAGQFTTIVRYKDLDGGSSNIVADTAHVYDGIGRLINLAHYHDMTMLAEYDLSYDALSRVTTLDFDSDMGNNGLSEYGYDHTNQVTTADHDYQSDEAFSFDENGNRTMTGYVTGDNNQLFSDGIWDYTYDDEGNRLTQTRISSAQADDKTIEYTWDHRNRLISIVYKNNSGTVTKEINYTYDLFNRRIEKEIDWDGAGQNDPELIRYLYDGPHIVATFNGDDELINRYLHGPAIDQVFADEQFVSGLEIGGSDPAGDVIWPLADNLGSLRDFADNDARRRHPQGRHPPRGADAHQAARRW